MEVRLNHNPRNPISAVVHEKVGAYLTLDFEQQNGNTISLLLPPHMGSVVHLIADLFNSNVDRPVTQIFNKPHQQGRAFTFGKGGGGGGGGGGMVPIDLSQLVDPIAPIPTGISAEGAMAIAAAISSDRAYSIGDVNTRGQILVRINDEATQWLDRGKAWVTAAQADAARPYGWETFMVAPDCATEGGGVVGISRR